MTDMAPETRRTWANVMAVGIGLGGSWLVMFYGIPVPKTWLVAMESLVFWLLVAAALLMAVAPLLRRLPSFLHLTAAEPAALSLLRRWYRLASPDAWGLLGALIVFALPVSSLWLTGKTTYFHIGGLLPWSDPGAYYFGGRHLLNEGYLDWWNIRRPLNAGFFATRLWLVNEDLQLALLLQTWVAALACFLAAREVTRSHGRASGVLLFALLYEFARPHLGMPLSESLGLSFGCLGFALLWRAGQDERPWWLLGLGMLFLTLGLNARAGAFFVLPALLVWSLWAYRTSKSFGWAHAGCALAGSCAGFLFNFVLIWQFGSGLNMLHSNLAYVLYGLAVGGKSWSQIYLDHPEVKTMLDQNGEGVVAQYIYELARQAFLNDPKLFLLAYWDGLKIYWHNVFFFVEETGYYETGLYGAEGTLADVHLIRVFQILSFFPLGFFLLRAWDRRLLQLGFVVAGIFVSAPLLLRNGGYRLFAATLPYIAAMPALGVACLFLLMERLFGAASPLRIAGEPETVLAPARAATVAGIVLAFSAVVGPTLAIAFHERPRFEQPVCGSGLSPVIFRLGHGSAYLQVLPPGSEASTRVPQIRYEDFRADRAFGRIEIASVFKKVKAGAWIVQAYDLSPDVKEYKRQVWLLVDDTVSLPSPGSYVQVCGRPDEEQHDVSILHVQSASRVEPVR